MPVDAPLVTDLQEATGDDLRSVVHYEETEYEMIYLREDVDAIYSSDELDDVIEDLRLQGWGQEPIEELFNAGELECSIFGFEEAMMFHFVTNDFKGVFVTYDRGADVNIEIVIDICNTHI